MWRGVVCGGGWDGVIEWGMGGVGRGVEGWNGGIKWRGGVG